MSQSANEHFPLFNIALLRGEGDDKSRRDAEWERAYAHFQPRLLSYFERRAAGLLPLEDLLQQVWLRAFLHVDSLGSPNALWTWLVTIGTNLLRDELRRNRPILEPLWGEDVDPGSSIAEFMGVAIESASDSALDSVDEMRAKLSEEEWEFLNLLCVDRLTHEEVARRLGLETAMASRQRLRRIRKRLTD